MTAMLETSPTDTRTADMDTRTTDTAAEAIDRAWAAAERVTDPEMPMLTLLDLGVLRDVTIEDGHVVTTITPTYSGCPAMATMRDDLQRELLLAGFPDAEVRVSLTPAWTSDWISAEGRRKLHGHPVQGRLGNAISRRPSVRAILQLASAARDVHNPRRLALPQQRREGLRDAPGTKRVRAQRFFEKLRRDRECALILIEQNARIVHQHIKAIGLTR